MIVLDTGVLYAAADRRDQDHEACVALLDAHASAELVLPTPVITESALLIRSRLGGRTEQTFVASVAAGDFKVEDLEEDYRRCAELLETYEDLHLGFVDASVVTVAERLNIGDIATTNHRDQSRASSARGRLHAPAVTAEAAGRSAAYRSGMNLASWAQLEAGQRLGTLEKRWGHSRAVARRAELVGRVVDPADRDVLVAAAYLHDVGYAPPLAIRGFHPLDGARWLAGLGHDRLAGLVAHHTGSKHEAALRGLSRELEAFPEERTLVTAALAYCDLTVGLNGESLTPAERLADVEARHGPESVVAAGLRRAWPELIRAVALVEERLRAAAAQPM